MRGTPEPSSSSYQSNDPNRFAGQYQKMSDDELLRLAKQQDDLFPEAVSALKVELNRRSLSSIAAKVEQDPLCFLCESGVGYEVKTLYEQPICSSCSSGFWWGRAVAHFVDNFLLAGLIPMLILFTVMRVPGEWFELFFVLAFLPYLFKDSYGVSVGKLMTGLEVIDLRTGEVAGFVANLKRNSVLLIPFVPISIAFKMHAGPRFGDGWAHTRVVLRKRRKEMIGDLTGEYGAP